MDVAPCDTCEPMPHITIARLIDVHGGTWCCPACMTIYRTTHLVE